MLVASGVTIQSAAIGNLPPKPEVRGLDPLVVKRTRFSADRSHRFTLFRYWGDPDDYLVVVGMNPSGADEAAGDRTVNRCCRFAEAWGFGALYMLNAMSIRLTKSTRLREASAVNLPENDKWIRRIAASGSKVLVAWGNPADGFQRAQAVEAILRSVCRRRNVVCFGKNRNGSPVHPLYQRSDAALVPFFD